MKTKKYSFGIKRITLSTALIVSGMILHAQTNVYDDVIATSANHTSLKAAIDAAGLAGALQDGNSSLTVFAPDNNAFDELATNLKTDIPGLLQLPNLSDILLYHVLGTKNMAGNITNGDIVTPLNTENSIKLTKTQANMVYANQAMVEDADLTADNGVVHSINSVILSNKTVVDVAIENNFTSLTTAVVTAELLPALTDPFAELTVFAPDNAAFDELATNLDTDINGVLALPNLADVLLYHVLGAKAESTSINNGDIVDALSTTNTIKLTKAGNGDVFANQAKVTLADVAADNGVVHVLEDVILPNKTVVDVAIENNFTSLTTAVVTAELLPALTDPFAELTVFAPDNAAFDELATNLDTDINGVLALPNLADVLLYHVLGAKAESTSINNGDIVDALSTTNTIKLTKAGNGDVFANQAKVTLADVAADNGVVHVLEDVILPNKTVVDVAIENNFTSLTTAVVTAELLPALTDPFAELTVFAPDNAAFDELATNLDTDINGVLALPNLADVLLYHVLGAKAESTSINNGDIVDALSTTNTIKLTKAGNGDVFANQAKVTLADVAADNGVVHVLEDVILPNKTVVDVAIENNFTSLATAVTTAELLPALSDPFAELTVFAPDNAAFDALATELGTDVNGILALPNLSDILLYHVVAGEVMSTDLNNGPVEMLNGAEVQIDLSTDVKVNESKVTLADVTADNGVVHVIDAVLLEATTSIDEVETGKVEVYPNPSIDYIMINTELNEFNSVEILNIEGKTVVNKSIQSTTLRVDLEGLSEGYYTLLLRGNEASVARKLVVSNGN